MDISNQDGRDLYVDGDGVSDNDFDVPTGSIGASFVPHITSGKSQ